MFEITRIIKLVDKIENYNYVAVDKSGEIYGFEEKPETYTIHSEFMPRCREDGGIGCSYIGDCEYKGEWKESLSMITELKNHLETI